MKLFTNHINSIIESLKLLAKGKFLLFFIPGILVSFIFFLISAFVHFIFDLLSYTGEIPWIGESLKMGVESVDGWSEVALIYILQFVVLTLLSPFNTLLSEKLENEITGSKFSSGLKQIIKDMIRMFQILLLGLVIDIFLFIIWDLTVANIFNVEAITPYYLLVINSFWFGFAFYDFSLERHKIGSGKSYGFAIKHFGYMIVTGALFTTLLQLPYFGVAIGSVLITMISTLNFLAIQKETSKF